MLLESSEIVKKPTKIQNLNVVTIRENLADVYIVMGEAGAC